MEEADKLSDEERANANTLIICDSESMQALDCQEDGPGMVQFHAKRNSSETESGSQSTSIISSKNLSNSYQECSSFNISDVSDDLKAGDVSKSLDNGNTNVETGILNHSLNAAKPSISPVVGNVPSQLSSTPILRVVSYEGHKYCLVEKENSTKGVANINVLKKGMQTPSRRRSRQPNSDDCLHPFKQRKSAGACLIHNLHTPGKRHHDSSDSDIPPAKQLKNKDDKEMSNDDNKVESEVQEHTVALMGSLVFVIDKSNNKISSAYLKQVSIAEDMEDCVPIGPNHRLSIGSGSDSSGNLADRSMTSSSTMSSLSLTGSYELPHPHFRSHLRDVRSGSHATDTSTSTSSSLTSVSRQNGARYLEQWSAAHHINDNPIRNSLLKLCRNHHIQLSCFECKHTYPLLEAHSSMSSPVQPQSLDCTPDILKPDNGGDSNIKTLGGEDKTKNIKTVEDNEEVHIESVQPSEVKEDIDRPKKADLLSLPCSRNNANQLMKKAVTNHSINVQNSLTNVTTSYPSRGCCTVTTDITLHAQNVDPCTSGINEGRIFNPGGDKNETSDFTSDSEPSSFESSFNSPFINTEDIFILPDDVKGKMGPNHRSKGLRALPEVEDIRTIRLGNGIEVLYPPENNKLFEGCCFLFTYTKSKSKTRVTDETNSDSEHTGKLSDCVDSELRDTNSSMNSKFSGAFPLTVPDLEQFKKLITIGGGHVYSSLDEVPPKKLSSTYLIASGPCRTKLYLQCLAMGIMRFSHTCIVLTCNMKVKFDTFISSSVPLPIGWSDEVQDWVMETKSRHPLKEYTVLLALNKLHHSKSEVDFWEMLLTHMLANVLVHKNFEVSPNFDAVSIVVTDHNCPAEFLAEAERANVPVVNCNWIIHTLIHGNIRKPSVPIYRYDYVPDL